MRIPDTIHRPPPAEMTAHGLPTPEGLTHHRVPVRRHLYNSGLGKVAWFVRRFGAAELVLKPLRTFFAPWIIRRLPPRGFRFDGRPLDLFYHRYNMTWASERGVEVPIAREYLGRFQPGETLEIGNVLAHYGPVRHEVLDKFERGPGIINQDIVSFRPPRRYGLVVSISTFEHIGFDDETDEPSAQKILSAIEVTRGLLAPGGIFVMTTPVGYNPELDRLIRDGALGATAQRFVKRTGRLDWNEVGMEEALACRYKTPFPYANCVVVSEFTASSRH